MLGKKRDDGSVEITRTVVEDPETGDLVDIDEAHGNFVGEPEDIVFVFYGRGFWTDKTCYQPAEGWAEIEKWVCESCPFIRTLKPTSAEFEYACELLIEIEEESQNDPYDDRDLAYERMRDGDY